MAEKNTDIQKIKELIDIMTENDLVKIDIRHGEDGISLERARPQPPASMVPIATPVPGAAAPIMTGQGSPTAEKLLEIKSPLVGTVYEAPSPDSDPYVEVDSHVDAQTVVCIIEAMKVMNEIKAEVSGTIVERIAKNGQAVEYGQVLFRVRPD